MPALHPRDSSGRMPLPISHDAINQAKDQHQQACARKGHKDPELFLQPPQLPLDLHALAPVVPGCAREDEPLGGVEHANCAGEKGEDEELEDGQAEGERAALVWAAFRRDDLSEVDEGGEDRLQGQHMSALCEVNRADVMG